MNEFKFHLCPLVNNPPPHPDQNPICHLLPPQPMYVKPHPQPKQHSFQPSESNSPNREAEITLGNSPQFSAGREPQRPIKNISHFTKTVPSSFRKSMDINQRQPITQIKQNPFESSRSRSKQFNSTLNKNDSQSNSKGHILTHSMTQRQKKSQLSLAGSNSERRQSRYCEACNPKESPRNNARSNKRFSKQKDMSPERRQQLLDKMEDIRTTMTQLQNLNTHLKAQLLIYKQKLKAKQSDYELLRQKSQELSTKFDKLYQIKLIFKNMEEENHYIKNVNIQLLQQIQRLKKQIVNHQKKNTETAKLIEKFNQNVSQKEDILNKEISEQKNVVVSLAEQNNRLQIQLAQANQKCKHFEIEKFNLVQKVEHLSAENQKLGDSVKVNSGKQRQLSETLQSMNKQLKGAEYQFHKAEERSIILVKELRLKQEDYDKLHEYAEQIRREKDQMVEGYDQDRLKSARSFQNQTSELRASLRSKDEQIERRIYENKELQMKLMIQNEQNNKNLSQLDDLKQQKKILYREKEDVKSDCNQLVDKNSKLFKDLEYAKQRQLQLSTIVSNYQKDLIQSQENISQNINNISSRDQQINRLKELIDNERAGHAKLELTLVEKIKFIEYLEDSLKKQGKVVVLYKQGLAKLQDKKDMEWNNMNKVYIEQIKKLQETIKELMDYNQNRRMARITGHKTNNISISYQSSGSPQLVRSEVIHRTMQSPGRTVETSGVRLTQSREKRAN